jgi:hypothetical protein
MKHNITDIEGLTCCIASALSRLSSSHRSLIVCISCWRLSAASIAAAVALKPSQQHIRFQIWRLLSWFDLRSLFANNLL